MKHYVTTDSVDNDILTQLGFGDCACLYRYLSFNSQLDIYDTLKTEKTSFSNCLNDLLISHIYVNLTYYLSDPINIQLVVDVKKCILNNKLKLLSYTLFQHRDTNELVSEVDPNASEVCSRVRQRSVYHERRPPSNKDGRRSIKTAHTMAFAAPYKMTKNTYVHKITVTEISRSFQPRHVDHMRRDPM